MFSRREIFKILAAAAVFAVLLNVQIPAVTAQNEIQILGYAWSENIGWISFNCLNNNSCGGVPDKSYGVTIGADGTSVSGYAWSDNIGWIQFGEPSNCTSPDGNPCQSQLNADDSLSGWAKALNGDGTEGWGGWIKLAGLINSDPPSDPPKSYGVTVDRTTGEFSGYAWSDVVPGWISFNCDNIVGGCTNSPYKVYAVFPETKFVEIKANGSIGSIEVASEESVTLSWTLQNVTNCTASWDASVDVAGTSSSTVNPIADTTYSITCTEDSDSVFVGISSPTAISLTATPAQPTECSSTIPVSLSWDFTGIGNNCTASGGWGGLRDVSGSESVYPVVTTNYTLTCGQDPDQVENSVLVTCPVVSFDLTATPMTIIPKDGVPESYCTSYPGNSTSTISVFPYNFSGTVNFSVTDWNGLPEIDRTLTLSPNSLNSANYSTGSLFSGCVASTTPKGIYNIGVKGENILYNIIKEITIPLNFGASEPKWREI